MLALEKYMELCLLLFKLSPCDYFTPPSAGQVGADEFNLNTKNSTLCSGGYL